MTRTGRVSDLQQQAASWAKSPLRTVSLTSFVPLFVPLFTLTAAAGTNKAHVGADHAHIAKLDRETDPTAPSKVAPSVGKAIGQARQAMGMTQKDLGTKINEKPQVVQEYESGKAIPNPQILAKLERALGVKLRGKDIGAALGGPSKKK